ncbi:MAG: hypothetical protein ACTSQ9_07310, partial [Candidatus Hodarchaeales archaeon]
MDYLQLKRVKLTSHAEKRIISRFRYAARNLGLRNFSELLSRLKSDQKIYENVVHWLEKGRSYNEKDHSFSPLITRKASLKEYVNTSRMKSKIQPKKKKIREKLIGFVSGIKMPDDQKNLDLIYDFLSKNNINYQA